MAESRKPCRCLLAWSLLVIITHADNGESRTLRNNHGQPEEPPWLLDYAVLGQQKSGTSTLWMDLKSHPDITWVGNKNKETLWFNGDYRRTTLCDNDLDDYQRAVTYARTVQNRTNGLVGDWSATHLSCTCCPLVFKTMNPKMKLLAVLRDPVQRALSRFMEQKVLTFGPCHNEVANETFASYIAKDLDRLQRCRETAARYGGHQGGGGAALQQQGPLVGWGAGMDLGAWMALQCAAKSNILGWSVYDVFLENYLAHFPQEQMLVLYTDDLAAEPLAVIRKVEAFLGLAPGNYSAEALALVYNSRGCYSWNCAKKKAEVRGLSSSGGGPISSVGGGGGDDGQQQQQQQVAAAAHHDGPFAAAVSRLVDLYRPHMQRLFEWADAGRIATPPESWRSRYGASRP